MNGKEFLAWRDEINRPISNEERKIIEEIHKLFTGREDVSEGMEQDGSLSEVDTATKIQIRIWDPVPEDKNVARREIIVKVLSNYNILRLLGNASQYSLTNQFFEEFITEKIIQINITETRLATEFCHRYMTGDTTLQEWLDIVLPK